jgi:2-polyprenyl-3-methyl-5-hydroxy-6-metoxy-1,4-benzoquinol methylase
LDEIKRRTSEVWGGGDYSLLSETLRPAAVALCDACAVSAGQEVLDVAAGDGNFALACAAEGASVVATDLATGMVERGKGRSLAEGYDVEWLQADAEDLPFEDERFECVGSVFGAMIARRDSRGGGGCRARSAPRGPRWSRASCSGSSGPATRSA